MPKKRAASEQSESQDETDSIVNVDFDFFDPIPIDYIALKRLLTQLFQGDAERLNVHDLTELIISQPLIGTTVKLDGIDSDPYACLTVLNLAVHKENFAIKALINYVLEKTTSTSSFQKTLQALFSSDDKHVGFVFSERLINMPVEIIPPMYRMLAQEIQWAVDENEPFLFSHYLFISRTYRSRVDPDVDMVDTAPPSSKRMKVDSATSNAKSEPSIESFHVEDAEIMKLASYTADYDFSHKLSREPEALGYDTGGRIMLLPSEKLPLLVETLAQIYSASNVTSTS